MEPADLDRLGALLRQRPRAALATLHRGAPAVSLVPFALWAPAPGEVSLLIHISALATHTGDLQAHPRASLLVADADRPDVPAQAQARVSLRCNARPLARDSGEAAAGRVAYLQRFPQAAGLFELGDFTLFALQPDAARLVAGFGRAHSLVGAGLQGWLLRAAAGP